MAEARTSRFLRRLAARRALPPGEPAAAALTEEDRRNLAEFDADTAAVTALLQGEIAAIRAGRLEAVTELYPQKAALLKRIELVLPVVEPFLAHRVADDAALAQRLAALKAAVQEDSLLLERMAEATDSIVRDMEKIRNRHSLDGMYGKSGRKVTARCTLPWRIDRTL